MSRNLGRTNCYFCYGDVVLVEKPREATRKDAGVYFDTSPEGYGYRGMICAHAECEDCAAKYLAYVDMSKCPGFGHHYRPRLHDDPAFFDLSFRSSFNDEPGEEDLPDYQIVSVPLTKAQCAALECLPMSVRRCRPWPRCKKTGRKVYSVYGCDCDRYSHREDWGRGT